MEKFTIAKDTEKMSSINRTIRFKPEVFDEIQQLHQATGVSFNKICAQCIEYALNIWTMTLSARKRMATMVDAFTRYAYTFPKLLDGAQESDGDLLMAARRYTENHFSAYQSLKKRARNMYSDMIGGLSTDFLIEEELVSQKDLKLLILDI